MIIPFEMDSHTRENSPTPSCILTLNGGSSSIKFALFEVGNLRRPLFKGKLDGIGHSDAHLTVQDSSRVSTAVDAPDHKAAVTVLIDRIRSRIEAQPLKAVGHRVVHGGPLYWEPRRVSRDMIEALRRLVPFDPEHLPAEILLIEGMEALFPDVPQVACFDTAFHHDMPRVARVLPIPRRFEARGIRRYGFHGLSCEFMVHELSQVAGEAAARKRVILAHLGSGASVTAVLNGQSMDTTMGLTPAAGIPMSTRSGDLDPGLGWYLESTEGLSSKQFNTMINHESGLLGISETSSDLQTLRASQVTDTRAAEAVDIFCYHARKSICAMAGVLAGVDTLVFSGGVGENSSEIRARICHGLEFLGIDLDPSINHQHGDVISTSKSKTTVRVIRTDEEWIIANTVCGVMNLSANPTRKK